MFIAEILSGAGGLLDQRPTALVGAVGTKSPGFHQKVTVTQGLASACHPTLPPSAAHSALSRKPKTQHPLELQQNPWENFKPQILQQMSELKDMDPSSRGNLVPYTLKAEAGARRRRSEPQLCHFLLDNSQTS